MLFGSISLYFQCISSVFGLASILIDGCWLQGGRSASQGDGSGTVVHRLARHARHLVGIPGYSASPGREARRSRAELLALHRHTPCFWTRLNRGVVLERQKDAELHFDRIHEKLDGMRDASKEELDEKVPGVGVQIMTASGTLARRNC